MIGSGRLLGNPKVKKPSSKRISRATLTREVQANTTIKLFIEDVASRLKSHLKKRKSRHLKLFASFFSKLSAEPDPLQTLSRLRLDILSDFLDFLDTAKSRLVLSDAQQISEVYQLLTESLDSTAELLSCSLTTVETNETVLNTLRQYVSSDSPHELPDTLSISRKETSPSETRSSSAPQFSFLESNKSKLTSPPLRKGQRPIYYYTAKVNSDFGFDLSLLASLFPASPVTSNTSSTVETMIRVQTSSVKVPLEPALQKYFNMIASFSREIVAEKSYPTIIADALEKLASSPDVFAEFAQFSSLPGISDFIEFSKSLNEDAINGLGEATIRDIARHLCDCLASETAQALLASYLSLPLPSDIESAIESITPEPLPEEEPIPSISLEKFAEEIALEGSTDAPTESDYIQFACSTLHKAGRALQAMKASDAAQNYLLTLLSQPDVLIAIAQSELPSLKQFADFLGQSWVNQAPTATLLQRQEEFVNTIVQGLQEKFPVSTVATAPTSPDLDAPSQSSAKPTEPPQAEAESTPDLPDISDFLSYLQETTTAESAPELSDHAETNSLVPDTLDSATAQAPSSAFDYVTCASNFLRQVILALPDSTAGLEAQAYLQSLLNSQDLLYALASSNQRSLVELATTLEQARLSNTPIEALHAPLSEAVGRVAGDLLRHFRSSSSSDEEEDSTFFTFSELIPPSTFASHAPTLDALSEEDFSLETPEQPATLETSQPDTLAHAVSESPLQETPSADAPSDLKTPDEVSSTFEDLLLLDDSALPLLEEEPSTPTLDELNVATPQPDHDLDFQTDDLLLPEEDLLLETPPIPITTDSDSLPSLPNAPASSDLAQADSDLTPPSGSSIDMPIELDAPELTPLSLETDTQPSPETTQIHEPISLETPSDSSETLDTTLDLNFSNELLLDESEIDDTTLDASSTHQDLSQLSSLSARLDTEGSEELSFSDTLDDSLLTESSLLSEDAPLSDTYSESSTLPDVSPSQAPALEPEPTASPLELPDLDFSLETATLDDNFLLTDEASSSTPQNERSSGDILLSDDSSHRSESLAPSADAPVAPLSSFDFLTSESYQSELAPVGDFQLDELQQIFLDEATEYLEKLNADLLELDQHAGTTQPELVNRVLRGAHTLKGSAAMVNLKNISDLAHKMEDTLQIVRDQNLKVPRALLDLCFKSLDAIGIMVENFRRTGEDRFTKAQPLMQLFAAYTQQLQETGTISDTPLPLPADTLPAAPVQEAPSAFQLDELQQIFLDEATEYLEKLNADLLELDQHAGTTQPELVNRVLRGAHTLKGSAAMVNLKNISDLAHKMEDTLQIVRDQNLKVPRALLDILFKSSDAIGTMLNTFRSTGQDALDVSKHVEILNAYMVQLRQTGDIQTPLSLETFKSTETAAPPKPKSVAEETVRVDIRSLNNLVNLSAELVIARNRLTNELASVTRLINKFMRERNHLVQINKKILTTIQKNTGERTDANGSFSDVLKEFSESEFDRFSDLDIISRDVRSTMLNLDETINELRNLSSVLSQNVVKVSGIANDLNREIVSMRMVPMRQMYTRFQRSFRDIAKSEGKDIIFNTEGEDTKLDKSVMEEIVEPIMHMIRNAIGHGIETPEVRLARGKPARGTITIRAYQKGSRIIIEIEDDGGGISIEKVKAKAVRQGLITQEEADAMPANKAIELIFLPGFSTADKITELSGRGVGMDVVRNTIRQLKGTVTVETHEGKGTKFIISLPITLAINQALLVSALEHIYAIPLEQVVETLSISSDYISTDENGHKTISIRGETIEFRYLNELLGYSIAPLEYRTTHSIIVIGLETRKVAVAIEKLIGKEEIVVKSLGKHLRNVRGIIGATILGDGQVVIILDIEYLLRPISERGEDLYIQAEPAAKSEPDTVQPTITKRKRKGARITVLHADDSPSVRKYVQSILQAANIDVISAEDGLNALNRLTQSNANIDIIISDLEMPRMNGFEFITEVRKMEAYKDIPFIIVTARAGDKHRRTGLELGANAFLNKPFDPTQLIETIESYIA